MDIVQGEQTHEEYVGDLGLAEPSILLLVVCEVAVFTVINDRADEVSCFEGSKVLNDVGVFLLGKEDRLHLSQRDWNLCVFLLLHNLKHSEGSIFLVIYDFTSLKRHAELTFI